MRQPPKTDRKGVPRSPETKAKLAELARLRMADPEYKARIFAKRSLTVATPEGKARASAGQKKRFPDPAQRELMGRIRPARSPSDETRRKLSVASKGRTPTDAAKFNNAASHLGIPGPTLAKVHADLVAVARRHKLDLDAMFRIARSTSVRLAEPLPGYVPIGDQDPGYLVPVEDVRPLESRRYVPGVPVFPRR